MTVGCPSNGLHASSISDLPAPAAQTSAGRASCYCLPWPAAMRRRPSLYPPAHPVIFRRRQSHPAADQSALVLPSAWSSAAVASPALGGSLPGPRPRPPRLCSRHGRSTWATNNSHRKRLTVGAHTRKCLLIKRKIMIPPPDSWDPTEGPVYFAKKRSPRCQLGPTGNASLLRTKTEYFPC